MYYSSFLDLPHPYHRLETSAMGANTTSSRATLIATETPSQTPLCFGAWIPALWITTVPYFVSVGGAILPASCSPIIKIDK